jgi:hypothetical protein
LQFCTYFGFLSADKFFYDNLNEFLAVMFPFCMVSKNMKLNRHQI